MEVLPAVDDPAILELEDDGVANVQVLAASIRGAALNADHAVVVICEQALEFGPEGPPVSSASWPKYPREPQSPRPYFQPPPNIWQA